MLYSDVLQQFYKITFESQDDLDDINRFFTGAACHFLRLRQSQTEEHKAFHHARLTQHVRCLRYIIFHHGNFDDAEDASGMNLNLRSSWEPYCSDLPDKEMFDGMQSDVRFSIGQSHQNDVHLFEFAPHLDS